MRPPPSLHSNFFSSLQQVEKRLKLENQSQSSRLVPPQQLEESSSDNLSLESLSSPIYLHLNHPSDNQNSSALPESSEIPQAFLSCSPQCPQTHENPPQSNGLDHPKTITEPGNDTVDDIERLIQLLGLSDNCQEEEEEEKQKEEDSCHCENGFYTKIAGVKGPKCGKEVKRLEGWIKYFLNVDGGEERIEPLRLCFLLLGKAAFVSQGEDGGFVGLDFPSVIEDFLLNDPPST